jgi:CubicO group peptidase (beta-lactamase class C family)
MRGWWPLNAKSCEPEGPQDLTNRISHQRREVSSTNRLPHVKATTTTPLLARRIAYSNTNSVLLGLIVEAATGKPIVMELRTRIFQRLTPERNELRHIAANQGRAPPTATS